jgi:hypothetical protein
MTLADIDGRSHAGHGRPRNDVRKLLPVRQSSLRTVSGSSDQSTPIVRYNNIQAPNACVRNGSCV